MSNDLILGVGLGEAVAAAGTVAVGLGWIAGAVAEGRFVGAGRFVGIGVSVGSGGFVGTAVFVGARVSVGGTDVEVGGRAVGVAGTSVGVACTSGVSVGSGVCAYTARAGIIPTLLIVITKITTALITERNTLARIDNII
jgi:hypothetical protein